MPRVVYRERKAYSGPLIRGTVECPPPSGERAAFHVDRACWLTAKVETGAKFGAVMAYDGTGMTAGPDQHIAVYPKELSHEDLDAQDDQGSLWALLRRLEVCDPRAGYGERISALWDFLADELGAYLAQDAVLRYLHDGSTAVPVRRGDTTTMRRVTFRAGDPVFGHAIRSALSPGPTPGRVPKRGAQWEQAKAAATMFHEVTAHPNAHRAQLDFGQEHLVVRTRNRRARTRKGSPWKQVHAIGYGGRELTSLKLDHHRDHRDGWDEALDLALCVYQCHSVNAPYVANTALAKAAAGPKRRFAENLIRLLGNNTYKRWDDDIESGRYDRTRKGALASKLWSRSLFIGTRAIMPKDLPG